MAGMLGIRSSLDPEPGKGMLPVVPPVRLPIPTSLPTWQDVKNAAPSWETVKNAAMGMLPNDPYKAAGQMVQQARKGDYLGAIETGVTELPQTGMFVRPYDTGRLRGAYELTASGASPKEIWGKTQTMLMPRAGMITPNQWAQEIPDNLATFNYGAMPPKFDFAGKVKTLQQMYPNLGLQDILTAANAEKKMTPPKVTSLERVLQHPKLYELMPDARNLPVARGEKASTLGSFDRNIMQMSIAPPNSQHDPLSTTLHELQHYIQYAHGWPEGGSPSQFLHSPLKEFVNPNESLFEAYQRLAGEQLASATEKRRPLTMRQRAERDPREDMIPYTQQIVYRQGHKQAGMGE